MIIQEREDVRLERSVAEVWEHVHQILKEKVKLATFESWVRPTKLLEINGDEAVIGVRNDFQRSWILNYHVGAIVDALSQVMSRQMTARLVVDSTLETSDYTPFIASISVAPSQESTSLAPLDSRGRQPAAGDYAGIRAPQPEATQLRQHSTNLNAKHTFDAFVVGSHNRFSHSAAMAVAERPGQAYNPLFIYGGVGLGKTHVMQAIGHHILEHSPQIQVRYMSCERFTNELINSIKDDRMIEFRKRYRQIDVLLMDDIQFIQGKERTQEEFFHTFNALRDSGRQIVLSSDGPPKALSQLEERLRSRFEWGLIADIQAPDLETRVAILRKKSELENMRVPDDVLQYIASLFTTNIRELEGALIRAHAISTLTGAALTLKTVSDALQPAGQSQPRTPLTIEKVIAAVAAHYRVETSELKSAKRSQDLALPRHVAMYLAHHLMQMSFPRIGDAFGGRKHTSIIYAHKKIAEQMAGDPALTSAISQITRQLGN